MPACKRGGWSDYPPQNEPEVAAADARARTRATNPQVKADSAGPFRAILKGVLAIFLLGLAVGSCVAGFMIPIRGVQWLFG